MSISILGLSAYYHDSAAALVRDGEIVAACQEERFTRKKHDARFPFHAIEACLEIAGIDEVDQLDYVAFYDEPILKFERILTTYLRYAPRGIGSFVKALPLWLKQKLWISDLIRKDLEFKGKLIFTRHHEAHAGSAFYPSPFEEAAILTLDGVGEWTTASYGMGRGNKIKLLDEIKFPHSLGLLYSAFTYFTGFRVNSGEYKLMGLAPYGEPAFVDLIKRELVNIRDDGSFTMNMKYFNYCAGLTMTNDRFAELFGGPPRKPETRITQREMDLARSIQAVTEEIMLKMAAHVHERTGSKNLVMAGGVALNCVGNGRILREGPFENIWIQPAAGDAGGALGCALVTWHKYLDNPRTADGVRDSQKGSLLGPRFTEEQITAFLDEKGAPYRRLEPDEVPAEAARLIDEQNVVGLLQGRMEFGPRALGARSIIGDARSEKMQSVMNLKIKYRESFRPFAPTALRERVSDYFELDAESPYMLLVAPVRGERMKELDEDGRSAQGFDKLKVVRSEIPAITHVDGSARVQTVDPERNPLYYEIVKAFHERTGCPVIINTSFNVRGEPIVCTPAHAYTCFMRTEMDYLIMENIVLDKREQPEWEEKTAWQEVFELD